MTWFGVKVRAPPIETVTGWSTASIAGIRDKNTALNNMSGMRDGSVLGDDSGFLPVVGNNTPVFVYTVVDRAPHFAACAQGAGSHCRAGMTFALNPTADQTYAQFNANAEAS